MRGPSRFARNEIGRAAERAASRFLQARGCFLVECNYRCRMGEIDLIMRQGATLVFYEVRYRARQDYGSGAESVDARKQGKLVRAAQHYMLTKAIAERYPVRFDVVDLRPGQHDFEIHWIPNAFDNI